MGAYEIEWASGNTSSRWDFKPWEKAKILNALQQIRQKLPTLVEEIDSELSRLWNECPCQYDFVREDLTKLRTVLVSVRDGIDSEDENLEFYRSGDQADRAALWSKPFLQDDQITFYDNVPWFAGKTWDQLPAESFNQLLFHELTHIYGTEDDDSEGPLHNAHTIQKMITGTLKGSPIYYGLLKDAKANCGGRCERDLINSDNWFWYIFP